MATNKRDIMRLPHHSAMELCMTRAKYRQGKKLTSVKVEDNWLQDELRRLCTRFGDVKSLVFVPKYAEEEFTDVYHVQYSRIQSARYAKHHLDGRAFYGGILHVCYAPEMESVAETRAKLIQRRKDIAKRTRGDIPCTGLSQNEAVFQPQQYHRQKRHPALPLTEDRLAQAQASGVGEAGCIWQGVPCSIDPRIIAPAPELLEPKRVYGPQKPDDGWALAGVREQRTIKKCSKTKPISTVTTILPSSLLPPKKTAASVMSCHVGYMASQPRRPQLTLRQQEDVKLKRFIPRQVRTKSQIVFHKAGGGEQGKDDTQSLKRMSKHMDSSDVSLDANMVEVREKIRAVSVPNVQVIFNGEDPLGAK